MLFTGCKGFASDYKNTQKSFKKLEQNYALKIYWNIDENFLPPLWKSSPQNATVTPLTQSELDRLPSLIKKILLRYPKSIIRRYLYGLYLSKNLIFNGIEKKGAYFCDRIYIACNRKDYNDIARIFHHEYSSILMIQYGFPYKKWKQCNIPEFRYKNTGKHFTYNTFNRNIKIKQLFVMGFLNKNSMSSLEEDFNVYSEKIFTSPNEMLILIKKYPLIKRKARIWLSFYNKMHCDFTGKYFFNTNVFK